MRKSFFLLLLLPFFSLAQPGDTTMHADQPVQLAAAGHRGFIIPHSRDIIDVAHSNPFGLEANVHWLLNDEKHVQESGLIAKRGFAAYYVNFDNPGVLGHSLAVVPYVEPLIRPWGRLYGSFQLGLGLAYVSEVYDERTNPTNLFFSLPVNLWAMLNAQLYYKMHRQWQLRAGCNYNHLSNGGMRTPNKGMNFPTFHAGLQYAFQPVELKKPLKNDDWKTQPSSFRYVLAVGSVKNAPATPTFPQVQPAILYGLQWMFGRRVARVSSLTAGTEWIHDGYERILLDRQSVRTSAWKGGLLLGHELLVGKIRFTTHLGAYVYNPSRNTDAVYQRYGLYYRWGQHLLIGSTLKAHRQVADVFDLRIGWVW